METGNVKEANASVSSSDGEEEDDDEDEGGRGSGSDSEVNEAEDSVVSREQRMKEYHSNCQNLIAFLKTRKLPHSLGKNSLRNVRNQAKTHKWDEGEKKLYYVGGKKGTRKLVLTDVGEIDSVIKEEHVRPAGSHMGINNTLAAISCKYVWMNMKMDIASYVSSCYHCQSKLRSGGERRDPIEFVQVDMHDEAEFSYEGTVMLIEGVKKRYADLSSRQGRLTVFKEVQEDLTHRGHSFSIGAVRRKWNSLVEMHKRMRREIYQKNPPWQFYLMVDNIFKEDKNSEAQKVTYPSNQGESANSYAHQEISYPPPPHHGNTYSNSSQGNLYVTHQETLYPGPPLTAYNTHQGQGFAVQPSHHGSTNTMGMSHAVPFFKNDANQSRIHMSQGPAFHPSPAPSLGLPAVPPPPTNVQPQGEVPVTPNIRREVQRLGAQQGKLNNQLKEVGFQCTKDHSNKRKDRLDKLKVRHLKKIGKELQTISAAQTQILSKQDQLLNVVMGRM